MPVSLQLYLSVAFSPDEADLLAPSGAFSSEGRCFLTIWPLIEG